MCADDEVPHVRENRPQSGLTNPLNTEKTNQSVVFHLVSLCVLAQARSGLLSLCAFLLVHPQDASHPGPGPDPHHKQVSGVCGWSPGESSFQLVIFQKRFQLLSPVVIVLSSTAVNVQPLHVAPRAERPGKLSPFISEGYWYFKLLKQ